MLCTDFLIKKKKKKYEANRRLWTKTLTPGISVKEKDKMERRGKGKEKGNYLPYCS